MTIEAAEDWFVDEGRAALEVILGAGTVDVASGPGAWTGTYLQKLIASLPAVRVAFQGAVVRDNTMVTADTDWSVIVVAGWNCDDEAARRRGMRGLYAMLECLVWRFHNVQVGEIEGGGGDPLGRARVDRVLNLWSEEWERVGVSIYEIEIVASLPMEPTKPETLDDFLRAGVDWDLPDVGEDADLSDLFDLPQ